MLLIHQELKAQLQMMCKALQGIARQQVQIKSLFKEKLCTHKTLSPLFKTITST